MTPCRIRFRNSKSTKNETSHPPAGNVPEAPRALHVPERAVDIGGVDLLLTGPERHAAAEPLPEDAEGNDEIRLQNLVIVPVFAAPDSRRRAPGQELGVCAHIGHQIVHLISGIGQFADLGMCRHALDLARHPERRKPTALPPGRASATAPPTDPGGRAMRTDYVIDEMISAKTIAARVEELAREIQAHFVGTEKLVVVGLLRGSFVFIADLVRELDLNVEVDFLEASSYGDAMESSREVRILKDLRGEIAGRDVLVVEDIVDTGLHPPARRQPVEIARAPAARDDCAPRQAEPARGRHPRNLDRVRDSRRIRRGIWDRLCATQSQPAVHRQGAVSHMSPALN